MLDWTYGCKIQAVKFQYEIELYDHDLAFSSFFGFRLDSQKGKIIIHFQHLKLMDESCSFQR